MKFFGLLIALFREIKQDTQFQEDLPIIFAIILVALYLLILITL